MEQKKLEEIYYESFKNIDFVNRYKNLMDAHKHPLDFILSKMDKSTIRKIFKELGYEFKISSPGQFYVFFETIGDYSFKISFQISGGIIGIYIYIYINNEYIEILNNKLSFLYRFLIGDMNKEINAPCFVNYNELKLIINDVLKIYEDFKIEFSLLVQVEN